MGVLAKQVRTAVSAASTGGWTITDGAFWCHAEPAGHIGRLQGWKLHLSATPASALEMTRRASGVLIEAGCAFKVALGIAQVEQLVSNGSERGSLGKVLTAYPADDEEFLRLAEKLHEATRGLPGPAILSDRAYRPESLVHYRFGAFHGRIVLSNDGMFESMLIAPDGSLVKDERLGWFSPPSWAACPLGEVQKVTTNEGGVLLAGRFEIHRAIRHGSKGGVFLGTDRRTGHEVVVKQARPHVLGLAGGSAARELLENEEQMLRRLAPHGLTPLPIDLFEQQGHLFLAQERVAGETLADYVQRRFALDDSVLPPGQVEVMSLARRILELVAVIHEAGVLVRDLSPNNLMVAANGSVRLVDLEYAIDAGALLRYAVGTPGFAAPEDWSRDDSRPDPESSAAGFAADRYSLGAVLFYVASGVGPNLAPDSRGGDSYARRLSLMVRQIAWSDPQTRRIAAVVLGLIEPDPAHRWPLDRVRRELAAECRPVQGVATVDRVRAPELDRLIGDGFAHLLNTMTPDGPQLWPLDPLNSEADPRSVQHGAAGVVEVLSRAAARSEDPALRRAVRVAASWLADRLENGSRLLPGLHFGASGAVWALHDAARRIGDPELAARALALAAEVPVEWPNPDICHGTAGAGLAQLRLWEATGSPTIEARVRRSADLLVASVVHVRSEVCWPIPVDFDSALAGLTHHGFAHGTAGIGAFLLAAGCALGEPRYLEMAHAAGESLAGLVCWDGDRAWWPIGEEDDPGSPTRMPHWCSGSSGIGTFLLRLWRANGDDQYRGLAEGAACAVRADRWRMGTSYCHGLAGDGHYLLDLAHLLDDPRYRLWAAELGACMAARAAVCEGRLLIPDDSGNGFSASFGTGSAGPLSFLMRLRDGGERPFTIEAPHAMIGTAR